MNYEERSEQSGPYRHFRSSLDVGMGIFYIVISITIVSMKYFGFMELSKASAYIFGGLMTLYGLFRIYRGIQSMTAKRNRNRIP
jgi:hypothetical protein